MKQDFVLETKRVVIPGYPHAFNPSIIRWQDKLLMSFRIIVDPKDPFHSYIGLIWLDDDFNPISAAQILRTEEKKSAIPSRAEDARLILVKDDLFMVYSDNRDKEISKGGFRVYLAKIDFDGNHFSLSGVQSLTDFEGESKLKREKNWVPFVHKGKLLLAYSLSPHLIFCPILGTGACKTVASNTSMVDWDWGELRGGTPAIPIEGGYLAFFHSLKKMATVHSNEQDIPHYFMGAYIFSKNPPFAIEQISPEPIVGDNFYTGTIYKPYWGSIRVVFPGGFLLDEKYIWIAYGRQDHEIWIVKLNKEGLLKSLVTL